MPFESISHAVWNKVKLQRSHVSIRIYNAHVNRMERVRKACYGAFRIDEPRRPVIFEFDDCIHSALKRTTFPQSPGPVSNICV